MSKIVTESFDFMTLTDAVQALPWPAGYSPTLPTGPNVTPINTAGISVSDRYQTNVVAAAGNNYGVITVATTAASITTLFLVPKYSHLRVYNSDATRWLALYPALGQTVPTGVPVITIAPGKIGSWSWTMLNNLPPLTTTTAANVQTFIAYYTTATATTPNVTTQAAGASTFNFSVVYYSDVIVTS